MARAINRKSIDLKTKIASPGLPALPGQNGPDQLGGGRAGSIRTGLVSANVTPQNNSVYARGFDKVNNWIKEDTPLYTREMFGGQVRGITGMS